MPQLRHRIGTRGSSGRNEAGQQRHDQQQQWNHRERDGIQRADSKQQAAQQSSGGKRSGQADQRSRAGQRHPLAQDHSHNLAAMRSQRHADADFAGALTHRVGDHAEQTANGQQQRHGSQHAEQQPGGTRRKERQRELAISRTRQMEICPTMRALAKRERLTPPACALSFSAEARSTRVPCHAGARPNKIPVSSETRAVNANTRASRPTSGRTGNVGGVRRSSTGRNQFVSTSPRPPLNNASSTLSVSTCRINRQRVAPIEERTAISLRRAKARASMRLAALAQAMTSTIRTAPISTAVNAHTVPRKGDGTIVDGKTAAPKSL